MSADRFSEISGERFKNFDESQEGHNVLMFRYHHHGELPTPLVGLWLTDELRKKQIEAAHYIPDGACERALSESGATSQPAGLIWLGLLVKRRLAESGPSANLIMPRFMIDDFSHLAIDLQNRPLEVELEDRFQVAITVTDRLE